MPCRDHRREITQSVFMMDWVFSFYVKTTLQVPAKGFLWLRGRTLCFMNKHSFTLIIGA